MAAAGKAALVIVAGVAAVIAVAKVAAVAAHQTARLRWGEHQRRQGRAEAAAAETRCCREACSPSLSKCGEGVCEPVELFCSFAEAAIWCHVYFTSELMTSREKKKKVKNVMQCKRLQKKNIREKIKTYNSSSFVLIST